MSVDLSAARQWARMIAECQKLNKPPIPTPAQFLLAHGKVYPQRRITRAQGIPTMCYASAYRVARTRKGYRYVEGLAFNGSIPVEHAWCLDPKGYVIDPTWCDDGCNDYFGVAFDLDFVARVRRITRSYSVLWAWWEWRRVWPLVRKEFGL